MAKQELQVNNELPPGCEMRAGRLVRVWLRPTSYGEMVESVRPVASSIVEAREKRIDFYDPDRGWLLEGWKWQSDPWERGLDIFTGQRLPSYIASPEEAKVVGGND